MLKNWVEDPTVVKTVSKITVSCENPSNADGSVLTGSLRQPNASNNVRMLVINIRYLFNGLNFWATQLRILTGNIIKDWFQIKIIAKQIKLKMCFSFQKVGQKE